MSENYHVSGDPDRDEILTRLAAAEARAEAAERKVAVLAESLEALREAAQYDRCADRYLIPGSKFRAALSSAGGPAALAYIVKNNPYRAALDTAADPDTPTPTRWERA